MEVKLKTLNMMKALCITQIILDIISFVVLVFVGLKTRDDGYIVASIWVIIAAISHIRELNREL